MNVLSVLYLYLMPNTTDFYLMSDQPTTCPICGARTDWMGDFLHTNLKMIVHGCFNPKCMHRFLEVDEYEEDVLLEAE